MTLKTALLKCLPLILSATALIGCEPTKPSDPKPDPKPDPDSTYNYNIEAKFGGGEYVYNPINGDIANYYVILSEMQMLEDGTFTKAGLAIALDMFALFNEDMIIPSGEYTFNNNPDDLTNMTLSGYTNVLVVNESLEPAEFIEFSAVQANVSRQGDIYTIVMTGTTLDSKSVHCTYTGSITLTDQSGDGGNGFPPLEENISTTFIQSSLFYMGKDDAGSGKFTLRLFDHLNDGSNAEGVFAQIEFISLLTEGSNAPTAAVYTVNESADAGTITPGWINETSLQNLGTTCTQTKIDDQDNIKLYYGIVSGGTVKIAISGTIYTVTVDLVADNGKTIKGQYQGEITVVDRSYHSTLTQDKEVNMEGIPCEIEFYGQSLQSIGVDGNNWLIYLVSDQQTSSDGAMINLVSPAGGTFAQGLPTGEYTVTKNYATGDYICVPGEYDKGDLYCSWYMGDITGSLANQVAPFREGYVLVDLFEGTYTISCEVFDDAPKANNIYIEWMGVPTYVNKSKAKSAPNAQVNIFKTSAKSKVNLLGRSIKGGSFTSGLLRRTLRAR